MTKTKQSRPTFIYTGKKTFQQEKDHVTHPAGAPALSFGKQQLWSLQDCPGRIPVLPTNEQTEYSEFICTVGCTDKLSKHSSKFLKGISDYTAAKIKLGGKEALVIQTKLIFVHIKHLILLYC